MDQLTASMLRKLFFIFYKSPQPTVTDLVYGMVLIGLWLTVAVTVVIEI